MKIFNNYETNEIIVIIPMKMYSMEIILKCFYWYNDEYFVELDKNNEEYIVKLANKSNSSITVNKLKQLETKIKQDLIDYSLRQIILNETQNIRDLIIAKAFESFETKNDE